MTLSLSIEHLILATQSPYLETGARQQICGVLEAFISNHVSELERDQIRKALRVRRTGILPFALSRASRWAAEVLLVAFRGSKPELHAKACVQSELSLSRLGALVIDSNLDSSYDELGSDPQTKFGLHYFPALHTRAAADRSEALHAIIYPDEKGFVVQLPFQMAPRRPLPIQPELRLFDKPMGRAGRVSSSQSSREGSLPCQVVWEWRLDDPAALIKLSAAASPSLWVAIGEPAIGSIQFPDLPESRLEVAAVLARDIVDPWHWVTTVRSLPQVEIPLEAAQDLVKTVGWPRETITPALLSTFETELVNCR